MAKHSLFQIIIIVPKSVCELFMCFSTCDLVSMATIKCVLLFYIFLLKLKLVSHFHPISIKFLPLIILFKFCFWISTSDVELCGGKVE